MKHIQPSFTKKNHADQKIILKFILLLILAALMGLFALRYGRDITSWLSHPEQVRDYLRGFGVWGVLGYIALQILGILIVVIPGDLVSTCGGYLYGVPWGFLLAWSSAMLGSVIAFYISRLLGYDFVSRLLPKKAVAQCNRILNSATGMLGMMVAFLIPVFPKDVLIYVAGLTPISATRLFFVYALARIPNTLIWAMVGSNLYHKDLPGLFLTLTALFILIVGGYLLQRKTRLGRAMSRPAMEEKETQTQAGDT